MAQSLNNLSVLISKPQPIKTGIVRKALNSNRWQIIVGKVTVSALSSVSLFPGQRVIVGQTNEGWAVLDSGSSSGLKVTEVKIAG